MKQLCYFAYCWDDPNGNKDLLEYLKAKIEEKSKGNIRVFYDKRSSNKGENFKENEKKILQSDSVIIFFSPAYKNIVDNKIETRGVWREYEKILEAWENNSVAVIPVVVEGKVEKAITREFKDNIAADFSEHPPIIQGKTKKKLNPVYKTEMSNLVSAIIYETSVAHRRKDYCFSNREEAYTVLFCNTESKNKLPRGCMYKSEAYMNVLSSDGTSFLVGRKGSGKTTFFEVLEKYDPVEFDKHFKALRPISVEDIREEHIYAVLDKVCVDHKIFGYERIIGLFWEIYLYLCAIYIVCVEEENCRIRDDRQPIFHKMGNKLRRVLNVTKLDSANVKLAIFTESVAMWEEFLCSGILDYATGEAFLASMDANFSVDNVLKDFLGKNVYRPFVKAIEQCEKNILIALDKFDAISDQFRRAVKDDLQSGNETLILKARKRAEFDKVLYHSLVSTVEKLKNLDIGIMGHATFCIIIPQDRVDQIKLVDRDFAKKNFLSLAWDGIELLEVILLRLKTLYKFDLDEKEDVVVKFKAVMKKYMPTIPEKIIINVDGREKEIELFQYLLRNSFWRPRDIIKYIAVLYDANQKNIQKHSQIDMETLKSLLNKVTNDIIEDEFYNEYDKIFYNITSFMELFEGSYIILSTAEFLEKIFQFEFEGVLFDGNNEIIGKLNFLYEVGIIGLLFEEEYIRTKAIGNRFCFVFNEGTYPLERAMRQIVTGSKEIKIVLNPIFSKKLSLKYNTTEIVGAYSWEYLYSNHVRKASIKRI